MPRAPYDTTCDLIYGPHGVSPGLVYASGNCRVVPESIQSMLLAPLSSRYGYITLDFVQPNQPLASSSGNVFTTDYNYADLIAVPSGGAPNYRVLFVERVNYLSHPVYYRAQVQQYVAPVANLLLWIQCNQSSGVVALDSSGNHFDAPITPVTFWDNATPPSTGFAFCLQTDGVTGLAKTAAIPALSLAGNEFTVGCWVNIHTLLDAMILQGPGWFLCRGYQTAFALEFDVPGGGPPGLPVVTVPAWFPIVDTWIHIVVTRVVDTFTLYVNGVAVDSKTIGGFVIGGGIAEFRIADPAFTAFTAPLDGKFSDVRQYDFGLSGVQVANWFLTGSL